MTNQVDTQEIEKLFQFIAEKTENVTTPLFIQKLSREFLEEMSGTITVSCLDFRIKSHARNIHIMNQFNTETKVKMMFALSAPVDYGFLEELRKNAEVKLDDSHRIIEYKDNEGGLTLSGTHAQRRPKADEIELIDRIADLIRDSMQQIDNGNQLDEEEEALFTSNMKRMAAFADNIELQHWNMWDILLRIVESYELENTQRDVCESAMKMLHHQLVFDLTNIRTGEGFPKPEQVRKLKKRRDQFIKILSKTVCNAACGVEHAWLTICDIMLVFGKQLGDELMMFESLVWRPDDNILAHIKIYLSSNVFDVDDSEEMDQEERGEVIQKQRQIVAQYAKLVIHGAIPVHNASDLFKRYRSHFQDFGDIFKNLLTKCREISFVDTGIMIAESLKSRYTDMDESQQRNPKSEPFNACRDLARRLRPVFGSNFIKSRYAVASLHQNAIDFAFDEFDGNSHSIPKNIFFLEIAMEFSVKLLDQDKVAISRYLIKASASRADTSDHSWEPYNMYLASLSVRIDDGNVSGRSGMTVASTATSRSTASSTRGRGRGRRF